MTAVENMCRLDGALCVVRHFGIGETEYNDGIYLDNYS